MRNKEHIPIDEVFQESLNDFEAPYQSGDWDSMQTLLEEQNTKPLIFLWFQGLSKRTKLLISLIMISTLATILVLSMNPTQEYEVTGTTTRDVNSTNTVVEHTNRANKSTEAVEFTKQPETKVSTVGDSDISVETVSKQSDIIFRSDFETPLVGNPLPPLVSNEPLDPSPSQSVDSLIKKAQDVKSVVDTARFYKTIVNKRWVDTTYRYVYRKPSMDIEDFWMGMYFTRQELESPFLLGIRDSVPDSRDLTYGFNLQFMSGNILPGEKLAIYGGLDWGMQFYGRSDKSEVLINSANQDRGLTFLRSHTNDIFVSGQVEWAQFPVVPYLTGSAGVRLFSTGQTTRALLASTEYESSTDNGVMTRGGFAFKYGAGVKLRMTPRMYFDMRVESVVSQETDVVDYTRTSFNGLDYDVNKRKMNLDATHLRFGLVFDLSEEVREKVIDEPGHWEEEEQTLFLDPSDSSKVFVPCPCDPCDTKKRRTSSSGSSRGVDMPRSNGPIFVPSGGSGTGGGGKSGFPGLKQPPVIKN